MHDEFFQFGLAAKRVFSNWQNDFSNHVGGGCKNKIYFHTYAEYLKPVETVNQKGLSGLINYHNFRSLVPIADIKTVFFKHL